MRVLALALAAVLACAPQTFAATLDELKQQQSQLEQEQEENQQKLDALKADQSKQQEYKDALDAQVQNLQSQIDALNAQIGELDASISEKDDAIAEKQRNIDSDVETLKERLCAIYMLGDASTLEIILQSESVIDMAQKVELLNMITEHRGEGGDREREGAGLRGAHRAGQPPHGSGRRAGGGRPRPARAHRERGQRAAGAGEDCRPQGGCRQGCG